MLKFRHTRRPLAGLIGLGMLSLWGLSSAQAQSNDTAGRWYQVEVILFTHEDSQDDETWRNDVSLSYPANWVELKDPNEVRSAEPASDDALATPTAAADLAREPFYRLPSASRELNRQADALKWSKSHQLLFHEAWRQPVSSATSTPSIVVSSGKLFGEHRELEGSFNISVSRYLHLSTNLWFTEFMRNSGVEHTNNKNYWPELPLRPSQKRVQVSLPNNWLDTDSSSQYDSLGGDSSAWNSALQLDNSLDSQAPSSVSKAYLPAQISVLQQQRRMRSGEVHYLDNPRVGMVILIKPYEVPARSTD
jgi:hypothetical protein